MSKKTKEAILKDEQSKNIESIMLKKQQEQIKKGITISKGQKI